MPLGAVNVSLQGEENYGGQQVYRIQLTPKKESDASWVGEALIERQACQPVLFLYARRVSMGLINTEFEKADVQSKIKFETDRLLPDID